MESRREGAYTAKLWRTHFKTVWHRFEIKVKQFPLTAYILCGVFLWWCCRLNVGHLAVWPLGLTRQARYVKPMLVWCWASVFDAGPTLNQHRFTAPRFLRLPQRLGSPLTLTALLDTILRADRDSLPRKDQRIISAHFTSKQILPFGFAGRNSPLLHPNCQWRRSF